MGVQCPFGAISSKPTAWAHFGVDLLDMPSECPHPKRTGFSQTYGTAIVKRHHPTSGTAAYSSIQKTRNSVDSKPLGAKTFVSGTLVACPVLLARYLVAKLFFVICSVSRSSLGKSAVTPKDPPPRPVARYSFSEKVQWMKPLRGTVGRTAERGCRRVSDRWLEEHRG